MTLREVQALSDVDIVFWFARYFASHGKLFNMEYVENCRASLHAYTESVWLDVLNNWDFPLWPRSLDAMHDAEREFLVSSGLQARYVKTLKDLSHDLEWTQADGWACFATARQRAEAFVWVMEESKKARRLDNHESD